MKLFDVFQTKPRRTLLLFIGAGVCVIGIAIALIIGLKRSETNNSGALLSASPVPLFLQNPLIPPEAPAIPDDYLLYRERKRAWSDEEVERWFTAPDDKLLRDLHEANNKMISDLLKAAP
jgi:hypothetical protein